MQYYRCKCGIMESYGSMSPPQCMKCGSCGSDLATAPDRHHEPKPHKFETIQTVQTDEGDKTLTLCNYCHKSKRDIEDEQKARDNYIMG
jgi:hypothetical protein